MSKVPALVGIVHWVKYLLFSASVDSSTSNIPLLNRLFKTQNNIELLSRSSLFEWARRTSSSKTGSPRGCPSCGCSQPQHASNQPDEDPSTSEERQKLDRDNDVMGYGQENGDEAPASAMSAVESPARTKQSFAVYRQLRQLSAELHCLYGVPIQHLPRSSKGSHNHNLRTSKGVKLHPYARSQVYDLRQHTQRSLWGPFEGDGSQKVDWEKVECLMIILSYNIQRFVDRYSAHDLDLIPPWDQPFEGVTPYSLQLPQRSSEIERPLSLSIDSQDPYGVTGVWMRVVCFLDYRELFTFNFSEDQPLPSEPRPPIDTEEAIRFIVIKMKAMRIEEPGEHDGKGLPIVHFEGVSSSALPPVDPNANSKIRGSVRLTPQAEVRWTTFSVFQGEERWRSEGIQVGGVQTARGIIGFWFDKDFDAYGPAGPTAFWKVSNDPDDESWSLLEA